MDGDSDPLGGLESLGRSAGVSLACGQCGWQGPEAAVGTGGLGPSDGLVTGCPRCGSMLAQDLPTIEEIEAARRAQAT